MGGQVEDKKQEVWPPKKEFLNCFVNENLNSSLLSKLLCSEINREATILMHCIHHTVDNKFYIPQDVDPEFVALNESSETESETSTITSSEKSSLEMDFYDEEENDLLNILNSYL